MMTRIAPWAGGQPWQAPQHIVRVALDPATGLALAEGCRPREGEARNELFVEGRAPKEVCPERARRERRASVWDRVVAWAGGVVERITQARETKLARAQRSDEDRATAEAENGEAWSPAGRRQREPDWTGFGEPRWRPPADEQWAEDASRALREAYEQRMYEQEQALEWLQGLAEQLRDNVEGGGDAAGERVRTWLDQAARALDEAAQSARRSQRRNVDPWLEEFGRELDRPRPRTRRQIDAEVRRALRELESVAARVR
jgi:hypothetical protein